MKRYFIASWRGFRQFTASYPQLGNVLTAGYVLMDANRRVKSPLPVSEYRADERPIHIFSDETDLRRLVCRFRYLFVYGEGDCPLFQMKSYGRCGDVDIAIPLAGIRAADIRYIAFIRDCTPRRGGFRSDWDGARTLCPFEVVIILPGADGTYAPLLGDPSADSSDD